MTTELKQMGWACLMFIVSAPLLSCATHVQPMACIQIEAAMGPFYRWPTANPGMVAPVNLVWNYPTYTNPLSSSFAGKSIQIDIPDSYGQFAGFHLGTSAVPTATDERFRLKRLDIRKPAQAYAGLGQALTHVMEMVLIHKQENGDLWSNVILPFQVSTNGEEMDIINPIIDGAKLPDRLGATGYVMSSAVSELMLSPAFDNATFQEFWGTAPAFGCSDKTENVRYFMRTTTLAIGVDTFQQLSKALENVPIQDPTQPPSVTWTVGTCRNGTGHAACVVQKSEDMQAKLTNLKTYQSQALEEQKNRKTDLDKKLAELKEHTGPADNQSIALFNAASAAFNDLQAAASELTSAEAGVAKVGLFATEASTATWDEKKPTGAAKAAPNTTTPAASLMDIGQQVAQAAQTALSVPESLLARINLLRPAFRGKRRVSV